MGLVPMLGIISVGRHNRGSQFSLDFQVLSWTCSTILSRQFRVGVTVRQGQGNMHALYASLSDIAHNGQDDYTGTSQIADEAPDSPRVQVDQDQLLEEKTSGTVLLFDRLDAQSPRMSGTIGTASLNQWRVKMPVSGYQDLNGQISS